METYQELLVFFAHTIKQVVSLPRPPCCILTPEHDADEQGAAKQEADLPTQDNSMPCPESWRLSREEDVGADDSIQISPTDDCAYDDSTLVDAFEVV